MKKARKGFTYTVTREQIEEYRKWPIEKRLQWLLWGNKMRKSLHRKTIDVQEMFRKGEI